MPPNSHLSTLPPAHTGQIDDCPGLSGSPFVATARLPFSPRCRTQADRLKTLRIRATWRRRRLSQARPSQRQSSEIVLSSSPALCWRIHRHARRLERAAWHQVKGSICFTLGAAARSIRFRRASIALRSTSFGHRWSWVDPLLEAVVEVVRLVPTRRWRRCRRREHRRPEQSQDRLATSHPVQRPRPFVPSLRYAPPSCSDRRVWKP